MILILGMSKESPKPKRPTKEMLERWSDLEMERTSARRAERDARDEQKLIETDIEAYCRENKPKDGRATSIHGYTLKIISKRKSVSWKSAFLRLCGADAAKQEEASVGMVEKLEVLAPTD